jgi:hypothetical protein
MPRNIPITPEKEEQIRAALEKEPHALRVTRRLKDVSYATVWRVADRASIELTAGREAKGYKRFSAKSWAEVERAVLRNPNMTQEQLARKIGEPFDGRPRGARAACRGCVGRIDKRSQRRRLAGLFGAGVFTFGCGSSRRTSAAGLSSRKPS